MDSSDGNSNLVEIIYAYEKNFDPARAIFLNDKP